ncbi:MAG: hypothetical protein U5J64_04915 [Halobacteriales archaeon]|nr:hypothetical protein [Halobacteriales archaeon]
MSGKEEPDDENEPSDDTSEEIEKPPDDETKNTSDTQDEDTSMTEKRDTDRLEEIQDELRDKEKELAEVRDELKPELREKEHEINDLREKLDDSLEDHERRLDELRDELREEIKTRRSPGGGAHSDRPAKAAGVILGVTGALGLVGAVATIAVIFSSAFTLTLPDGVGREAVYGIAGVSALVSLVILAGGWQGYKKQRWYFVVFTAVVASVVVSPLGLPALILVALAEPSFD